MTDEPTPDCGICLNRNKKEMQDVCDHCPCNEAHKLSFELDQDALDKMKRKWNKGYKV